MLTYSAEDFVGGWFNPFLSMPCRNVSKLTRLKRAEELKALLQMAARSLFLSPSEAVKESLPSDLSLSPSGAVKASVPSNLSKADGAMVPKKRKTAVDLVGFRQDPGRMAAYFKAHQQLQSFNEEKYLKLSYPHIFPAK